MVRNEKGLWVKVEDEGAAGSTAPEAVAKVRALALQSATARRGATARDQSGKESEGDQPILPRSQFLVHLPNYWPL